MDTLIPRDQYMDFLVRYRNKQIIKVISGIRRCGKSTLFELFKEYLFSQGIDKSQVISINFEDISFEKLTDYKLLHDYITKRLCPEKMTYVFLDEIQHVHQFEKAIDSLHIRKNIDIYLTGSNAYFMSGELATLLSGRYIEIRMLPLSFKEFCSATDDSLSLSKKYQRYVTHGSFPYTLQFDSNEQDINEYLNGLYNTIVLKDIIARYKINDILMLESVIKFIFNNIGNRLSSSKIANTMASNGRKIDIKTVEKYLSGLIDSLIIYQAKRYNIKGRQYLRLQEKYYLADLGLRHMLLGGKGLDVGHILENVIFLELIRRGYQVFVGQSDNNEVDFVAMKSDENLYIQVAASVRDASTFKREIKPLQNIEDNYPKVILTLDEDPEADYDGIKRVNALEWLLK